MKNLISALINLGVDLSTRNAFKHALRILGEEPDNADKLYIELKNMIFRDRVKKMSHGDIIVFLPHCMRDSKNCKASMTEYGYDCTRCEIETCKIFQIRKYATKKGYKNVFIVPGGSMVFKIINEYKPKGVIGIACMKELILAAENLNIPGINIELDRDGCINTDVSIEKVKSFF